MSYTDEYLKALEEEKKKKKKNTSANTQTKKTQNTQAKKTQNTQVTNARKNEDYTSAYLNALEKENAKKEDIAPVGESKSGRSYSGSGGKFDVAPVKEEGGDKDSWLKSGAFSDGYQVGDIVKTNLSTALDFNLGVVKGAARMVEGVVDLGTYGVGAVADAFGADKFAEKAKKVARYSATDEWTKGITEFADKNSYIGNKGDMISEGLGQVGTIILTGGLAGAASGSAAVASAVTTGATGLSTMGTNMGQAYDAGATDGEAFVYGLTTGAIEAGTELLFGGLGKGVKALGISRGIGGLDDMFAKKLSSKVAKAVTNESVQKVLGNSIEYAVKSGGEGLEEVLSGLGSAVMKKLTYEDDETLKKLIADENLLEQFVVGAVTSSIVQGGDLVTANKSGTDFVTGYTSNEEKVINKAVEKEVAEREANGEKLTTKEKNAIYDSVVEKVENGSLGVDIIEEILGGESYEAYKTATDENASLKKERDELNKIKTMELTGEQSDRLAELKGMNLDDTTNTDTLKKKVSDDVYNLVKNDRGGQGSILLESYREVERRGQAFTADLTKYEGKQREAIERAINSGVLNNTNRSHELVGILSKIEADKGIVFDYTDNKKLKESGFAISGKTINGYVKDGGVTLNMQSAKAWESTVGHEITHVLEGTSAYSELQSALFKYAESKGELATRRAELTKLYEGVENANIDAELTADLVGDYLFSDKNFINHLTSNRNVFQKVYDEIKYLWNVATGKEKAQIEKVKREFDRVWKEQGNNTAKGEGTKYSITEAFTDNKGNRFENAVLLDTDFFDGISPRNWGEKLREKVAERATDNPFILPIVDESGNTTILQFAKPNERVTKNGKSEHKVIDKLSSSSDNISKLAVIHIDEIVSVSEENLPYFTSENKHQWLDENGWLHRNANVINQKNGNIYNVIIDIAKTADGRTILYATDGKIKKVGSVQVNSLKIKGSGQDSNFFGSVPQSEENVNTSAEKTSKELAKAKLSVSTDSNENNLTPEQQEYFKDSKVVDENGKLKVMYHGSPNGDFTVFKSGSYFTENKEYADIYQNQGASSLSYKKTANHPNTYAVYLDIKKPFDTRNKTERDIFYNEYYRKWGTGTELMESGLPDWTDGQDLQEFLEENGYDYDGLILDEGATGGYGDEVKSRGLSYVIFNPEQVKNIDNTKPTNAPDIRFSLSKSVEETKDLVAVHNMQVAELEKSLNLGGLPMPSIAIIKAESGHSEYGDVSLVFPKSTIDPKANKSNKVYGGDAWTPVYPKIEFKANEKVQKNIRDTYYRLADKFGYDEARPLYNYAENLEDALNQDKGEAALIERLGNDTRLMQLFLLDSGKEKVADVMKETKTTLSKEETEMYDYLVSALGEDAVNELAPPEGVLAMHHKKHWWDKHGEALEKAYGKMLSDKFGFTEEQVENVAISTRKGDYLKIIGQAYRYLKNGAETVKTEKDYEATEQAIVDAVDTNAYHDWLNRLFKGVEEKSGIRNNAEAFTPSGNRRSWEALHWENNLENVVKVMKAGANGSGGLFGGQGIWGVSAKDYRSVAEIKADSSRLQRMSEEEYKEIKEGFGARLTEIAQSIMDKSERNQFIALDNAMECIVDAIRVSKTKSGILNELKQYQHLDVTETTVDDIVSLVSDISNMPTEYFEAKPQRAVGFDEVATAIIPDNASAELKAKLTENNIPFVEYESGNEQARLDALNSVEDAKFSLSNEGEMSNVGTPMKDLYFEQDIAPVKDVAENATTTEAEAPLPSDSTPISSRLADGTRGNELLYDSLKNYPMETMEQKVAEKIRSVEGELNDNRELRNEAKANYSNRIAKLQEQYENKKNKDTLAANNILKSISRLEGLKARADADYAKRISDLEARLEKMKDPKYVRALYKKAKMEEHAKFAENLVGDTSTWVDKKLGLQYAVNTERRNFRDIIKDENGNADIARADAINDALNGQYNREEANKKRELAKVRGKYADMKITKAEDAYAQMLGELRHNPETALTDKVVNEYYEQHKDKIDKAKVDKIIELARKDYDDLFMRVNEALRNQGMREIPYRKGYFPHFTDTKQNFIQKLFNWKTQDNEIPTSIAGLTEAFKPVKSWQAFDKTRHGDETDYSFMKGFDSYSDGALDWIYHIDTLQKRRAVENHIRFTHSDEGIQARIKEVYASEEYDATEAQAQIEHILSEANNPLNNFVQDFTTHTNVLAGKKNSLDRTVEQLVNRKIYSVMQNVQNRTSANMVLANIRSAMTNFIPITQSWAQVSPLRSLQATKDTIANAIKDDGMIDKSTFLTNRLKEVDNLYQTNWDKVLDKAGIMFEIVDNFSSQVIWRSKYSQNLANGMSEADAIANADQFAENVMAGRSKGNEPTLFTAKNPLVKAFTMFQLEVNNQYGYLFKDVPNDLKTEANHWKTKYAVGLTTAFVGAYVYNELFKMVAGSKAAFDPIGIIKDLLRDLGLFDDDEEKEPKEVATNLVENVVGELPFVGGLFGGGRIPISSALPYGGEYGGGLTGAIEDVAEGNWKNIGKEMMKPVMNVALPVGGGQIKKTYQGLKMFSDEHPITGSYTDSGSLRFPVEDTPLNRIQAGLFGQYASKNAREYFDNGYAPLKEKQIQEYQDVELPIGDYWKYREGLSGLKSNEEKAEYINSLDIEDWQKNLLMNNILDRKNDVDMSNYDDYGDWEEFDYAQKNPEKYEFFKANGISYSDYANADEDGKNAYTWAYNNPEKYTLSKAVADDVITYRSYTGELYDIKADKDENGKSINGSRKEKVIDYLNNLDASYETKIILFKTEYPSDDTYNNEIIEHLNNREDLTYDELVTIYSELGFTVKDGKVYWD